MSYESPKTSNLPARVGAPLDRAHRGTLGTSPSYAPHYPDNEAGIKLYEHLQEVMGRFGLLPVIEKRIPRTFFRSDMIVPTPVGLRLSNGLVVSRRAVFQPNTQESAPRYDPAFYCGPERQGHHFAMMPNVFKNTCGFYGTFGNFGRIVLDEITNPNDGNSEALYAMSAGSTPNSERWLDVKRTYLAAPTGDVVMRMFLGVNRTPDEEEVSPAGNKQLNFEMDCLFDTTQPGVVPDDPRHTIPTDITAKPAKYMEIPSDVLWQRA